MGRHSRSVVLAVAVLLVALSHRDSLLPPGVDDLAVELDVELDRARPILDRELAEDGVRVRGSRDDRGGAERHRGIRVAASVSLSKKSAERR